MIMWFDISFPNTCAALSVAVVSWTSLICHFNLMIYGCPESSPENYYLIIGSVHPRESLIFSVYSFM